MSDLTKELLRKLVHLTELPIIAGYSFLHFYFSPKIGILSLTALLLILLEIEYFRVDYQTKLMARLTELFAKFVLRQHEKNNITGAIFFVISTIIAFSAFDYQIALIALLMTVFGDLASAIIGTAFGKRKIFRNKSYAGTLSGFLANIIIGAVALSAYPEIFIPMAFIASIVEMFTQKLDDNLTVPIFAGFMGQMIIFLEKIALPPLFL